MVFLLTSILLPPLLVFGLYHLLTWINAFRINERAYWKRVAIAAAVSHVLLVTGFIVFTYWHFRSGRQADISIVTFGAFVFNRSEFWRLMLIFDTAPMIAILMLLAILQQTGLNPPGLLFITFGITYLVGTLQWFFVGGGIGALLERLWEGLKSPEDEDDQWPL